MKKKEEEMEVTETNSKALEIAMAAIHKQFGKGSIQVYGDKPLEKVECISTGSISLDMAMGGGFAKGRVVEVLGPNASGKTTITLQVIAEAQKAGGTCAFIDAEHALDPLYASNLGVDMPSLLISQPDSAEQALNILDTLVSSGALSVIVVDSVAALVPQKELEGEIGQATMGLQARLMSQVLRKITANVAKTGTLVIFINQIRMKFVMFGNPETSPGGEALKYYASQRLDIRQTGKEKGPGEGDAVEITGTQIKVKVIKNKIAPPFREAELVIHFGTGIDKLGDLITYAIAKDVIEKSGAWLSFNGERLAHGVDNAKEVLGNNPKLVTAITEKCRNL